MSLSMMAQIYNTAPDGDKWYIIKTRNQALYSVNADGDFAVHRSVVFLVSGIWNTAEVTYISEFNYDHKTIDILWGYVGSGHDRYLALKATPLTAGWANGFTIKEITNPTAQIELEEVANNLVTPILPQASMHIDEHAQKVGIGTTTPTEKLSVNGTIRSKEVKVEANNWPDYVFATDYVLPTLSETETYIQENHRLPNMPSAEEIAENGIALGEMNRLLVEKVEELTLHVIQLEKDNQELNRGNMELKEQVKQLPVANSQFSRELEELTLHVIELEKENRILKTELSESPKANSQLAKEVEEIKLHLINMEKENREQKMKRVTDHKAGAKEYRYEND